MSENTLFTAQSAFPEKQIRCVQMGLFGVAAVMTGAAAFLPALSGVDAETGKILSYVLYGGAALDIGMAFAFPKIMPCMNFEFREEHLFISAGSRKGFVSYADISSVEEERLPQDIERDVTNIILKMPPGRGGKFAGTAAGGGIRISGLPMHDAPFEKIKNIIERRR